METFPIPHLTMVCYEDDGAHCSPKCPHIAGKRCSLWHQDLIRDGFGYIPLPVCRESRISNAVAIQMENLIHRLNRENGELKATLGRGVYCGHKNPEECGRSALVCTKDGPCELQITDGVRCQGFHDPCMRMDAKRARQKTKYTDDERNWATYCPECQAAADEFWKEQWDEYWHGRL